MWHRESCAAQQPVAADGPLRGPALNRSVGRVGSYSMSEHWLEPVSLMRRLIFGGVGSSICFVAGLLATAGVQEALLYGSIPGFLLGLIWPELKWHLGFP